MGKVATLIVSVFMLHTAFAGSWQFFGSHESALDNHSTTTNNKGFAFYTNSPFVDDITADQKGTPKPLTKAEQHQALVWGLTTGEEQRYVRLMHNQSGFYFKQMSPVQVLGINARTDKERVHFAAIGAQHFMQRTAKIQAYSKAAALAQAAIVAKTHLPRIRWTRADSKRYSPLNFAPIHLAKGDTVFFFLRLKDSVRAIMAGLLPAVLRDASVKLNIYFVDKPSAQEVSTWAENQGIPPQVVTQTGQITLNPTGAPALPKGAALPALYIARGGHSLPVDMGQF